MWESILGALSQITLSRGARDDDAVDQFHHFATVAVFAAFASFIGMNQYVGDPIHCLTPSNFEDSHKDYAENLCWISQMYYVPMEEEIPFNKKDRMTREIGFYRWIVVVFLFQCLLFKFPNMLWKELRHYSGINVQKIVSMAEEVSTSTPEGRDEMITDIAVFIDKWLLSYRIYKYNVMIRMKEKMSSIFCFCLGKRQGTYLTGLYLFVKFLNLVNVISQFAMLTAFLRLNFWTYGFNVIKQLSGNIGNWTDVNPFPHVVFCDFHVRQMQNIHIHTLQCVLSINMFIEKIFIAVWFWLFLLSIATIINFGKWCLDILFSKRSEHFIQKYLIILGDHESWKEKSLFREFVRNYLRDDGVFLLRSVGNNSSEIILMDLIKALWNNFKKENMKSVDKKGNANAPPGILKRGNPAHTTEARV